MRGKNLVSSDHGRAVLRTLARVPGGLTIYELSDELQISFISIRRVCEALRAQGELEARRSRRTDPFVFTLPVTGAAEVLHFPPVPVSQVAGVIPTDALSGQLLYAARLLNALSSEKRGDPRYLACQGGYSYPMARRLHAELMLVTT